jgi:hypothetical protein
MSQEKEKHHMDTVIAMSSVLTRILERKRCYANLPFFEFLRHEAIDAANRIAFYPCMAHFILSFGDLNKYILRQEPAADVCQDRINAHSYEDDHHWPWYLEDFSKLGFDRLSTPSEWMRFLWSDDTSQNRILMYRLTALIDRASSVERIAIVEAIEETGNVLFKEVLGIAMILEERLGVELRYCGLHHYNLESGHAMGSEHREIATIEIDTATRDRCLDFVDQVFDLFSQWTEELLNFATHNSPSALNARDPITRPPAPIGPIVKH